MKNNKCIHLKELLEAERLILEKEIQKNQYLLSRKRNHQVDWKEAEKDFTEHFLATWAEGFKSAYCNYVCPLRGECDLWLNGNLDK